MNNKRFIRVTIQQDYILPAYVTESLDELKETWFKDMNSSHASRDGNQLGGTKQALSVTEISEETIMEEIKNKAEARNRGHEYIADKTV